MVFSSIYSSRRTRRIYSCFNLQLTTLFALTLAIQPVEILSSTFPVQITEIMYNPPGGSAFEFIEIQNTGPDPINLSKASWSGINFRFPGESIMEPGAVWVLTANEDIDAFLQRYPGLEPKGLFGRNLSNS